MAELPQDRAAQALPTRDDWPVAELQAADPAEMLGRNGRHTTELQADRDPMSCRHDRQAPELPQYQIAARTKGVHAGKKSPASDEVPPLTQNPKPNFWGGMLPPHFISVSSPFRSFEPATARVRLRHRGRLME